VADEVRLRCSPARRPTCLRGWRWRLLARRLALVPRRGASIGGRRGRGEGSNPAEGALRGRGPTSLFDPCSGLNQASVFWFVPLFPAGSVVGVSGGRSALTWGVAEKVRILPRAPRTPMSEAVSGFRMSLRHTMPRSPPPGAHLAEQESKPASPPTHETGPATAQPVSPKQAHRDTAQHPSINSLVVARIRAQDSAEDHACRTNPGSMAVDLGAGPMLVAWRRDGASPIKTEAPQVKSRKPPAGGIPVRWLAL